MGASALQDSAAVSAGMILDGTGALVFVGVMLIIGVMAWLFRTVVEGEPDPFLLNLCFFAFAGQAVWVLEQALTGNESWPLYVLFLVSVALLILEVLVYRRQVQKTREHYEEVLRGRLRAGVNEQIVGPWAEICLRITGVDFWPELYKDLVPLFSNQGPRKRRRKQAIRVLPVNDFDLPSADDLEVNQDDRRWLWRSYALLSVGMWILLYGSIEWAT